MLLLICMIILEISCYLSHYPNSNLFVDALVASVPPDNDDCEGDWMMTTSSSSLSSSYNRYDIFAARTIYNHSDHIGSVQSFMKTACPAQRAAYTCYFATDDPDRAYRLDRVRFFKPRNTEHCKPFTPLAFLKLIRNRRVLMLGDSVSAQTWESLVCALYDGSEGHNNNSSSERRESHIHTRFTITYDCTSRQCPHRPAHLSKHNPLHAHVMTGYYANQKFNTSLSFYFYSEIEKGKLRTLLDSYQISFERGDIVIYNHGLFYNNISRYEQMLTTLKEEILNLTQLQPSGRTNLSTGSSPGLSPTSSSPERKPIQFFLLETTPQHFPTPNGYFPKEKKHMGDCVPLNLSMYRNNVSDAHYMAGDWRNRMLHEYMQPLIDAKIVAIIPTAEGLKSQYDAHIMRGDCTHWCNPSAIFKYLHLIVFNTLSKHITSDSPTRTKSPVVVADNEEDMTWRLYPTLRNGEIIRLTNGNAFYRIEKGKLRPFYNAKAFIEHTPNGTTFETVKAVNPLDVGELPFGETIYATSDVPKPVTIHKVIPSKDIEKPNKVIKRRPKPAAAATTSSTAKMSTTDSRGVGRSHHGYHPQQGMKGLKPKRNSNNHL